MANVRINEIDLLEDPDISELDSTLIIDKETKVTRRLTLVQLGKFLNSSVVNLRRVITSEDYTLETTERAVFVKNDLSSTVTITLPDAALAEAKEYHVVKGDELVGTVIISASGSQEVNGENTFHLNGPHQSVTLISNGTGWYIF